MIGVAKLQHAAIPSSRTRAVTFLVIVVLLRSTTGCCQIKLLSEDNVAPLRALKGAYESLPRTSHKVPTFDAAGRKVEVAVHEVGTGSRENVLVLIHGVFCDHRAWRFLSGNLGVDHDLLLVDMPGCGESGAPKPELLGPDGYSIEDLAHRILQAIQIRLETREGPRRVVLVAHSLGGAVALRMAGTPAFRKEFGDLFRDIEKLVLLSPFDVAMEKPDPVFQELASLTDIKVKLGARLGVLQDQVARSVYTEGGEPGIMPEEHARTFLDCILNKSRRHANQEMLKKAVPWLPDGKPAWDEIESITDCYRNIDMPCLLLWGARDETLCLAMGYKLQAELPDAILRVVHRAKHTPQVECPLTCARVIREFLSTGDGEQPLIARVTKHPLERGPITAVADTSTISSGGVTDIQQMISSESGVR